MFKKLIMGFIGFLLMPLAAASGKTFFSFVSEIGVQNGILVTFERGVLVYLLIHIIIFRPVKIYVFAHEMVHVLATWLCGGKVENFDASSSGGQVVTSKTNFFIELSPYFVPIYTIFLGPIYVVFKIFGNNTPQIFNGFIFFVGITMAFHLVMTAEILKIQQSDIMKSGVLFSFILIFVGNLFIIMAVFCPIFENLSFIMFIKQTAVDTKESYAAIYENTLIFIELAGTWYTNSIAKI